MKEILGETSLDLDHVQVMVRGMHAVAQADGVHQVELVLLKEFYEVCRAEAHGLTRFEDVVSTEFELEHAKEVLNTRAIREAFLKSCLFLAYADGSYSEGERRVIAQFAEALNFDSEARAELERHVGGQLVQQVARIKNLEALKSVVSELNQG